jgi:ABC-type multidrug transport system permease subunit
MSRLTEIRELSRARVLLFLREPEAIFWVFVFPMVLAAVLGFAFRSGGIDANTVAVVQTEGSDAIIAAFEEDEHLEAKVVETEDDALEKLRKASVDGLIVPGSPPRLMFDPDRAESATARLRVERVLAIADGAERPALAMESVRDTGSRYVDFLFPGLLGMNLMGTGMWSIGFAIADIRRRRLLRRLMVTPMRRSSFFLGFILSRLVFLVLELGVLACFGRFVLGVPFVGNVLAFAAICLLGAATFAGLGILVASRARTIEGVSGLMNAVMMPMWLASGVFFSYEKFPEAVHPLLKLLPLTALNDALRAVMLQGESLFAQGPELLIMTAWAVVGFAIALRVFRWE